MDFGYKLHLTSTTGDLVVPLTADITTANVPYNKMYVTLTSSSPVFALPIYIIWYLIPVMMIRNCKSIAKVLGIDRVYPVKRYERFQKEV
jgi:hypothetical protein